MDEGDTVLVDTNRKYDWNILFNKNIYIFCEK